MTSEPPKAVCPQFKPENLNLSNGRPLGAGAISQVVSSVLTSSVYPLLPIVVKIISKLQLLQQNKVKCALDEKEALLTLAPHPFIARLYGTAQSEDELYFVMEKLPHGDLLQHIRRTAVQRLFEYNGRVYSGGLAAPAVLKDEDLRFDTVDMTAPSSSSSSSSSSASGERHHRKHTDGEKGGGAEEGEVDDAASSTSTNSIEALERNERERAQRLAEEAKDLHPIDPGSPALRCLDFGDIQLIAAQLVLALGRAAEKGVVLRDLKPENVVFDDHYRLCLIDFDTVDLEGRVHAPVSNQGIALPDERRAKLANPRQHHSEKRRLTVSEIQEMRRRTSCFCGTAQYVSPEMAGECVWSFSSDLWALGAVVYELLYGTHMFGGSSALAVLRKVVHGIAPDKAGVLFPYVRLSCRPTRDAVSASSGGNGSGNATVEGDDAFERVKDFILRLVCIDPMERLGVRKEDASFDLPALQSHALFRDFDWATLEEQVAGFVARPFPTAAGSHSDVEAMAAAYETAAAALPSLRPLYDIVPYNSPAYADYVYRATADANPFEHFFQKQQQEVEQEPQQTDESAATVEEGARAAAAAAEQDSDRDSVEIVDDVGMHYTGNPASEDFRNEE